MEDKKKLAWKEADGTVLYGIPDLNRTLKAHGKLIKQHNRYLRRYYTLATLFVFFVVFVVLWVLWQVKKYRIITLLIDAIKG